MERLIVKCFFISRIWTCFYHLLLLIKEANSSPTVKLTPRSKVCIVIVVVPIDFLKTLTIPKCFFFTIFFFIVLISISGITVCNTAEDSTIS